MAVLISCKSVSHTAGTKPLFRDITFSVNQGDKIGLSGHNGCGKSTLLSLLADSVSPDSGEIARKRGLRIATVEQFLPEELAETTVLDAVIERIPEASRSAESYRAEITLQALGFDPDVNDLKVSDLSGGQQNRLMIARALVSDPELVLFDEPSNHMDVATLALLQRYLREELRAAFVLVSHDRTLLDEATDRTIFLRDERVYHFDAPYSSARHELAQQDLAAAAARQTEEKKIESLRASAKRLAIWGKVYDNEKLARKAKTMAKRADRLDEQKTFVSRGSGLQLSVEADNSRANRVLRIGDLEVRPGGGTTGPVLLNIDELILRPGERVVLLGENGVGKTSLIRALVEHYRTRRDDVDHIAISPQATLGYYDQELSEFVQDLTMLSFLRSSTAANENEIRAALIHAGFAYQDHTRRVAVLSGGERARLLFVQLQLNRPNFLILDEPTNHIDIQGKEELEEQLMESGATLLITSHDRRFIDTLATSYWLVRDRTVLPINDPDEFYDELGSGVRLGSAGKASRRKSVDAAAQSPSAGTMSSAEVAVATSGQDALLERVVELEEKLEADRGRKKKFQKPALQAAWQAELNELYQHLEGE